MIGKSICRASKEALIAVRDVIDDMTKNYIEYEYGDWKKDYKYKIRPHDEWDEILKGNDYY
jgi:hypothetical protein